MPRDLTRPRRDRQTPPDADDAMSLSKRLAMLESATVPRVKPANPRDAFDEDVLTPIEGVSFAQRPIDIELVRRLAALQLDDDELIEVLQVDRDLFEKVYQPAAQNGRAQGKTALRRMQWRTAMRGNVSMLIHLGNQYLAQSEKKSVDMTGKIDATLTLENPVDPRETLLQMLREAAERLQQAPQRLSSAPIMTLPQPALTTDEDEL